MCGIFFSCDSKCAATPPKNVLEELSRRGPDHVETVSRCMEFQPGSKPNVSFHMIATSSVLALRGNTLVPQPIRHASDPASSLLLWNGEAWRFDEELVETHDGDLIFGQLCSALAACSRDADPSSCHPNSAVQAVLTTIAKIAGPYSFVFYDSIYRRIFYARDALGRRSLLVRRPSLRSIEISSIRSEPTAKGWEEVEAKGIYYLDLGQVAASSGAITDTQHEEQLFKPVLIPWLSTDQGSASSCHLKSPLPLLNMAYPIAEVQLSLESGAVNMLSKFLQKSLALRLSSISVKDGSHGHSSRIAILFSGGLDCSLIARIAHDILPLEQEIDLLNVAFENPRVQAAALRAPDVQESTASAYERCPDRKTGRASCEELKKVCSGRSWRFVSINIPYHEMQAHKPYIMNLIHPHDTEMDLSIGAALYFAARGCGLVQRPGSIKAEEYATRSRVLLSGLGADEIFAGYSRHARAFDTKGRSALLEELELDFSRLSSRNLGRDDRVMACWGREVRYPFLDEDLLSWALRLPVESKCTFGQSAGFGPDLGAGKNILRLLAWKLGIKYAAAQPKRAIQFGARTAKMTSGKTKGHQAIP